MSEFFDMGGYAAYVWPAYAVTLIVVLANAFSARRRLQSAQQEARRRLATRKADA